MIPWSEPEVRTALRLHAQGLDVQHIARALPLRNAAAVQQRLSLIRRGKLQCPAGCAPPKLVSAHQGKPPGTASPAWTEDELRRLLALVDDTLLPARLAAEFPGRTVRSCTTRLARLRREQAAAASLAAKTLPTARAVLPRPVSDATTVGQTPAVSAAGVLPSDAVQAPAATFSPPPAVMAPAPVRERPARQHQCAWLSGDRKPFRQCDGSAEGRAPYCERHSALSVAQHQPARLPGVPGL